MSYLFLLDGVHDPRGRDYTGPGAKYLRTAALLSHHLTVLSELVGRGAPGYGARLWREAEKRIGGISMHWRNHFSSGTTAQGNECVEVAVLSDVLAVRDSKEPDGPGSLSLGTRFGAWSRRSAGAVTTCRPVTRDGA